MQHYRIQALKCSNRRGFGLNALDGLVQPMTLAGPLQFGARPRRPTFLRVLRSGSPSLNDQPVRHLVTGRCDTGPKPPTRLGELKYDRPNRAGDGRGALARLGGSAGRDGTTVPAQNLSRCRRAPQSPAFGVAPPPPGDPRRPQRADQPSVQRWPQPPQTRRLAASSVGQRTARPAPEPPIPPASRACRAG